MDLALECFDLMRERTPLTNERIRQLAHDEKLAKVQMTLASMRRIEATVKACRHAADRETGLMPDMQIPAMVYHAWAAKFKMQDMEAGIHHTTGYECWEEGSGFYQWWKKRNMELAYVEEKRCAQSSIVVPETRWSRVR